MSRFADGINDGEDQYTINSVTYKGLAWRIIMGSIFVDRVYWRFFTITVDYNRSHIELLLNDVYLSLISNWSLLLWYLSATTWTESDSYIMTDGQLVSLCWNKEPFWGLRADFYYYQTVACLLMWDDLSDESTGLTFTIAAGSRQRSYSRVRVPWDSRPYFTVSDLRLPFLSPPTIRRVTVDVFKPHLHTGHYLNSRIYCLL
jgi:hypothetical protein